MISDLMIKELSKFLPLMCKLNIPQTKGAYTAFMNQYNYYVLKKPSDYIKTNSRNFYLDIRNKISLENLTKYSLQLSDILISNKTFIESNSIALYLSFGSEYLTSFLIKYCFENKKKVFVPLIINKSMVFTELKPDTEFKKGQLGILEPTEYTIEEIELIDLIVVPGLVFNELGFRVGYGGGYYDKVLTNYKGKTISLILPGFIDNSIIVDPFDVPVDKLIFLQQK